jgi:hypothetical protein
MLIVFGELRIVPFTKESLRKIRCGIQNNMKTGIMSNLVEILILLVNTIFDRVNLFLTSFSDVVFQPESAIYVIS